MFSCKVWTQLFVALFFGLVSKIGESEDNTCNDNGICNVNIVEEDVEFLSDEMPIVIIDYNDLKNKESSNLESSIGIAYGASGLGILLVKNVPNLSDKRERILKISRQFAYELPSKYRENMVNEKSFYSVGWSHGKEKLAHNQADLRKGSFYANPIFDDPTNGNEKLIKEYPAFYYPNIWPHSDNSDSNEDSNKIISEIGMTIDEFGKEMRDAFMTMGSLITDVGFLLSDAMDHYVSKVRSHTNYERNTLSNAIKTKHPKGRLLYYFSENEYQKILEKDKKESETETETESETERIETNNKNRKENEKESEENEENEDEREDSWCGWHNDHSALTGLALGMYFNENGEIMSDVENSVAGLHIKTRLNETYHLHFSEKMASQYLAFQIGETSQILSGGALYATPHAVHGPIEDIYNSIGRASLAVFMQPSHDHHMRAPSNVNITLVQFDRNLPPSVPTLKSRWNNDTDDTFGKFSHRTFETYY